MLTRNQAVATGVVMGVWFFGGIALAALIFVAYIRLPDYAVLP